jgi:iron complex outermembrane receptor protein
VALFANRIDNYIFTHRLNQVIEEGYLTYAYTQGDARLLGFEAGADFHPVHSVHFSNTFSFVDARLMHANADTRYLPFTPAPCWASELKWELYHHSHPTVNHHHTTDAAHRSLFNNLYVAVGLDCYLKQTHIYRADNTETPTPGYALLSLSAGTDIQVKGRKVAELYVDADNLLDKAYQNHLSRLKYADDNVITGRSGVFNMGRNITFKVVVPINI